MALGRVGQVDPARTAVKRGLKALDGPGADGLRLELLIAMYRARPEDRVLEAIGALSKRISGRLSSDHARRFRQRAVVERTLSGQ